MVLNELEKARLVFEILNWTPEDRKWRRPKEHYKKLNCERCGEPLKVRITQSVWGGKQRFRVWVDGVFHHKNGDRDNDSAANITLVCYHCHVHYHKGLIID